VPERDRTADLTPARRDDRTAPAPTAIAPRHGAPTDREQGRVSNPPCCGRNRRSRDGLRVMRPPRRIVSDVSANAIQRLLVANNVLAIATPPRMGVVCCARAGLKLALPKPRSIHDIGPCLLLCIRPLMCRVSDDGPTRTIPLAQGASSESLHDPKQAWLCHYLPASTESASSLRRSIAIGSSKML
jgi:hypothetical protein